MTVGVLILAAGQSSRMGSNKLLRELGGRPMLAHLLESVGQAGLPALGVTGADQAAIASIFDRYGLPSVHNADFARGMSGSIRAGIAAVPTQWNAAIIALGDMPLVSPDLLESLASRGEHDALVAPFHAGRRGQPVLWGRHFFGDLAKLEGDAGARDLITVHQDRLHRIDWPDDTIFADADTPEAFDALAGRMG